MFLSFATLELRRKPGTISLTAGLPWLLILTIVAGFFAFRAGVPGFFQDWIWPHQAGGLIRWFVADALSQWDPQGLGGSGAIPTFNFVYGLFAFLAKLGFSVQAVLFIVIAGNLTAAICGMKRLLVVLDIHVDPTNAWALAGSYGLGPVCFQKIAAGHLFWLAAYSALPWLAAYAWQGCGRKSLRAFAVAAILYAVSSTQIQFLAFDAFVLFVIVAVHPPSRVTWLGTVSVLCVGLIHNTNVFAALFRPNTAFGLSSFHATVEWERGMSGAFLDLSLLGGYLHHDIAALPPGWRPIYVSAKASLPLLALASIALVRDRRTVAFAIIGAGALLFANGWKGPLEPALQWSLFHLSLFTVFRELYHIMALYALAVTILAALALQRLPVRATIGFPVIALVVASPFLSLGLDRLVPAVPVTQSETFTGDRAMGLRVLLPAQEPVSQQGIGSAGLDPARLSGHVATAGNAPLVLQAILDPRISRSKQLALLADMGISRIAWRNGWFSDLPAVFEPGVGATFVKFRGQQRVLRRRYARSVELSSVRSILSLEPIHAEDILAGFLADDQLPPGRNVAVTSSFIGNDIDRQWVSSRVWSWFAPEANRVIAEPVYTKSSKPLHLEVDAPAGSFVYVLADSHSPTLAKKQGVVCGNWRSGPYRWFRWPVNQTERSLFFRSTGFSSVARVIVSTQARWSPSAASRRQRQPVPVNAEFSGWSATARLPKTDATMRLIFARAFSPGWHLSVEAHDLGSAHRSAGIFNGWIIGPAIKPRSIRLFYAQTASAVPIIIDVVLELTIISLLIRYRNRATGP